MLKLSQVSKSWALMLLFPMAIVGFNNQASASDSNSLFIDIDCQHKELGNSTRTKSAITVEFYDGKKLVAAQTKWPHCDNTHDATFTVDFRTSKERDAVDSVKIKTESTDSLLIDEMEFFRNHSFFYYGRDNGKGWCLSANKNDGKKAWKKYVDQSVGCRSCFKFTFTSKSKKKATTCG